MQTANTANAEAASVGPSWSPMQLAIFEHLEHSPHHLVVKAAPGSGKTTTLVEGMSRLDPALSALVVAFNKQIADELTTRLPSDIEVRTMHALGLKTIQAHMPGRTVDQWATANRIQAIMGRRRPQAPHRKWVKAVVSAAKLALAEYDELDDLADGVTVPFPEGGDRQALLSIARRVLVACLEDEEGPIDFDDMIWLPLKLNLSPPETYDVVGVDEAQDLSPAQLDLVLRHVAPQGRVVAVGDARQAIYGWRGADRNSIATITNTLDAVTLPLSVSYRCAKSIVQEAQQLWPHDIQAASSAPEGITRWCAVGNLSPQAGDFVLSRSNAPLVTLTLRYWRDGIRAYMRGRDVGDGLRAFVERAKAKSLSALSSALTDWCTRECNRLAAKDRPIEPVTDKAECLEALIDAAEDVDHVLQMIDDLFAIQDDAIVLSSTHKAKGLEADRVWVLWDTYKPNVDELLRLPKLKESYRNWLEQLDPTEERNLLYVAVTRAKHELIKVKGLP